MRTLAKVLIIILSIPCWLLAVAFMCPVVVILLIYSNTDLLDDASDWIIPAIIGGEVVWVAGIYLFGKMFG
jgi:hypothetical protein